MKKFGLICFIFTFALILASGFAVQDISDAPVQKQVNMAIGDPVTIHFRVGGQVINTLDINTTVGAVPSGLSLPNAANYANPPTGYDANTAKWYFGNTEFVKLASITDEIVNAGHLYLDIRYFPKVYQVTFVFPGGVTKIVEASHGSNITNIPSPELGFAEFLVYDQNQVRNITSNRTVVVEIQSYLVWLIVGGVAVVIALTALAVFFINRSGRDFVEGRGILDEMIVSAKTQDARIDKLISKRMIREEEAKLKAEEEKKKNKPKEDDFDEFLKKI